VKKKRFAVEQIVAILKQAELGIPIAELIRQVGISEQTFYRWKKKYTGLEVDQVRQLKQIGEENIRLKRIGADLTLDKAMLQDVLPAPALLAARLPDDDVSAFVLALILLLDTSAAPMFSQSSPVRSWTCGRIRTE
jgi:putative transposase